LRDERKCERALVNMKHLASSLAFPTLLLVLDVQLARIQRDSAPLFRRAFELELFVVRELGRSRSVWREDLELIFV
jgi:hypothetical protein